MIRSTRNTIINDDSPPFCLPNLKKIRNGSVLVFDEEKKAFIVKNYKNVDPLEIVGFDYFISDGITQDYPITWHADQPEELLVFVNGSKVSWTNYTVYQNSGVSTVQFNAGNIPSLNDVVEIYGVDQIPFSVAGVTNALVADVRGENQGGGSEVFVEKEILNSIHTLKFRTLIAGSGVTLQENPNDIMININQNDIVSSIPNADENTTGLIRIATQIETDNGTNDSIAVTPKKLKNSLTTQLANLDASTLDGSSSDDYAKQILSSGSNLSQSLISKATAASDSTFNLYGLREGNGIIVVRVDEDVVISNKNGGEYIKIVDDYAIENDKYIIGVADTSSPRTLTLPDTAQVGRARVINVKDESNNANINNITIVPKVLSQPIDGNVSYVLNQNGQSVTLYCDGNEWYVIDLITANIPIPGGVNTSVQINKNGSFFGSLDFTYDDIKKLLTINGGLTLKNDSNQNINAPNTGSATQYVETENITIGGQNYIVTKVLIKMSDGSDHIISQILTPN